MRGGGEVTNCPAAARRAYLKLVVRRRGTVGWGVCADLHVALDDTRQPGPVSAIGSYGMGPSAGDYWETEELGRDDVHVRVASNLERRWQGRRSGREVGCYRNRPVRASKSLEQTGT